MLAGRKPVTQLPLGIRLLPCTTRPRIRTPQGALGMAFGYRFRVSHLAAFGSAVVVVVTAIACFRWTDHSFDQVQKTIETGVFAIGLLSLFFMYQQGATTARWNKSLSYHQLFNDLTTPSQVEEIWAVAHRRNFEEQFRSMQPMLDASVRDLLQTEEQASKDNRVVKSYLDRFESLCGAVNCGLVYNDYAYSLEATRVIRVYTVFEPLITSMRALNKYSRCYLELERLATEWRRRRDDELEKKSKQDGVRPHV